MNKAANAQGNMSNAGSNTTNTNITGAALGVAKDMTSNMSATDLSNGHKQGNE